MLCRAAAELTVVLRALRWVQQRHLGLFEQLYAPLGFLTPLDLRCVGSIGPLPHLAMQGLLDVFHCG